MSDPVFNQMIAVPGMKIAYHFQIAEGQMIAYEVAEDRTASLKDLNELLDRIGDAAARQKAKHDLPFARLRLRQNREKLEKAERALHDAIAKQEAHVQQLVQTRRNANAAQPLPTDINAVTQAQSTLQGIIDTIRFDELEIPRLEAIIAGRPPPEEPLGESMPTVFSIVAAE
jgi:hypothetical protein